MSDKIFDFNHLVLLVGTNPLPNFIVADYFLEHNENIETIWLIHSEDNNLQAGTNIQADNLSKLLEKKWKGKKYKFEFLSLSDASHAKRIRDDIQEKMIKKLDERKEHRFHLNYTGGTKAMSTHLYWILKKKIQTRGEKTYSYLDARNFRLVDDDSDDVIVSDLRNEVSIEFEKLIELHGFECKQRKDPKNVREFEEFKNCIRQKNIDRKFPNGWVLEDYVFGLLEKNIKSRLNNKNGLLQNPLIKRPGWRKNFELDVLILHGYHLTGISCTLKDNMMECKWKGFEIIHRIRQIGGDESKVILMTKLKSRDTKAVQDELIHETGGSRKNILAMGVDDLFKEKQLINKISKFIF
ncbi:hypothetical protein QUF80_01475 [Desulfococcaceae bacterium HSG8]|nr:hypothetical protein [Desulfococcaceae bacterium HSG8]